jgi:hypothetical protein
MGKLDTVTVNGPEDEIIDWDAVQWHRVEDDVRRLRQRIFTATRRPDSLTSPLPFIGVLRLDSGLIRYPAKRWSRGWPRSPPG